MAAESKEHPNHINFVFRIRKKKEAFPVLFYSHLCKFKPALQPCPFLVLCSKCQLCNTKHQ